MSDLVERLLDLWSRPAPTGPDAAARTLASFAAVYTDPVTINGTPVPLADLVARADVVRNALADVRREVLSVVEAPGRVGVAFRLHGRHVGPLPTAAGPLAPTGAWIAIRVIDLLDLDDDGRIRSLWMTADELGLLASLGRAPALG